MRIPGGWKLLRTAEYTALTGATVKVTYDVSAAYDAGGRTYLTSEDHILAVLRSVVMWSVRDVPPSRKTWRERVPIDVAEGCAAAIILSLKAREGQAPENSQA